MTDPFPPGEPATPASPSAGHFAVAVGRFYEDLAARLLAGVQRAFDEAGATFEVHDVPGAYELPLAALYLAETGRVAGVACLGAVIRGETTTTTTSATRPRAGSRTCSCAPACRARSGC